MGRVPVEVVVAMGQRVRGMDMPWVVGMGMAVRGMAVRGMAVRGMAVSAPRLGGDEEEQECRGYARHGSRRTR